MVYDLEYWKKFADESESKYNYEFSKFIRDLAVSLRATSVLEIGCNTGNDLKLFPETISVAGIDPNDFALEKAKKELPEFEFKNGETTQIPYEDSSFDFVFTHNVLNYVPNEDIPKAIAELFRVSKKYILNCELYQKEESKIENNSIESWYRNVLNHWMNFKVKIISDVDMHEDIEPQKPRFTLVRKV